MEQFKGKVWLLGDDIDTDIIIPTELADVHYKSVITKRNRWMISQSDLVIVYSIRNYGGAYYALKYAHSNNKSIITLGT